MIGCFCISRVPVAPRKPARSVTGAPVASVSIRPWSSWTGRSSTIGSARSVLVVPARSTCIVSGSSRLLRIAARTSAHVETGVPLIEVMVSPGLSPAALAGAIGMSSVHSVAACWPCCWMSTHSLTAEIVGVATAMPLRVKMPVKRTSAMSRFITGPPIMMTIRFQIGSW